MGLQPVSQPFHEGWSWSPKNRHLGHINLSAFPWYINLTIHLKSAVKLSQLNTDDLGDVCAEKGKKYLRKMLACKGEKPFLYYPIQAWHWNLRSDSVLVHTGYIGTGAILVPGFGNQP